MSDVSKVKKVFLSYLDDNNKVVSGYVDLVDITDSIIKINTDKNILIIPLHRVLKMKEKRE